MQEPRRVEDVRDQADLEVARAQRVEERVRGVAHAPRGRPRRVLGLEEARQPVLVGLDTELGEQLPDESRVLDLLDRPGREDAREVLLAETRCHLAVVGRRIRSERGEPGLPPSVEQLLLEDEVVERVAPVEKHGVDCCGRGHRGKGRVPSP